jgi:hypothetical protein
MMKQKIKEHAWQVRSSEVHLRVWGAFWPPVSMFLNKKYPS